MTDAVPSNVPSTTANKTGPTSPLSGAVPAQHPARSYANATKTATPTFSSPAGASTPAQDAKPQSDAVPVNGISQSMAQGGPLAASNTSNGTTPSHDHGRKPSVIINASGATGHTPNGGPVSQNGRPPINFGSINSQGSPMPSTNMPHQPQAPTSLPTPPRDPRASSPAHSPSPIPQPSASGGRPPSGLQGQSNGMPTFGSIGGDGQQMQPGQMPPNSMGPGIPMHERRQSSQSMLGGGGGGRGRGYPTQQPYGMPSPGQAYRQLPPQTRTPSNMGHQFQQQMQPSSPYNRGGRGSSPAINHSQPNMPPQMGGNPSMQQQYGGYPQHVGPQHQQGMYGMPHYDPQSGYYQPFYPGYGQYPNQTASPGPHRYPTPFNGQQGPMQPPFHPPSMSRSASQASERPSSSMGQAQTPSMQQSIPTSQTPVSQSTSAQSSFVKPSQKKSSAIKITDAQGNPLDFNKPKPSPSPAAQAQQSSSPLIVRAPKTATPPPRVPSAQHNRVESKSVASVEDTRNAFLEQVKRRQEEDARKDAEEAAKAKQEKESSEAKVEVKSEDAETAAKAPVKEAAAEAEKAAAVDAGDKEGEKVADAAASAATKDEGEKTKREETEDERMERMIAEMEAAEREEEEREKAYAGKQKKEKEERAKRDAESSAKQDEELKRQEREAEEREAQREREREQQSSEQEADQESKDMFSALKKPTVGPGATATESGVTDGGAETPKSEGVDSASMPPPQLGASSQSRAASAQKLKPAHLKLETAKRVEPAEPTPGMQALKSARFLGVQEELNYPSGFKSPNPALNQSGSRKARSYDKDFLLQFQNIFKEKPSVDWDQKVKETLGPSDEAGSARPQSARTPSSAMRGGRSASGRPSSMAFGTGDVMGSFQTRTLPSGTTSDQRFMMSSQPGARSSMGPIPGPMGRAPSQLGMPMARTASVQSMGGMGAQSPGRAQSGRGPKGGSSRRGDRNMSRKEEMEQNSKMPLTAHMEVTPLEKSQTGWKASSIGQASAPGPDLSGLMAPDMVQRKVKAALNKMTPEKFDKIADQILEIAAQSKHETDGRTLRQVIQLTFEKACDEAHWAGMYAQFCHKMLTTMSNEIRDETIKDKTGNPVIGGALFRKYLLNRCQEEFERGWQVNLPEKPEGDSQEAALMSDEYYVAAAAKRRGLGLIQFIGQLYKLRMLTLRIMHECVLKLLNFEGDPDEAAVENLTTLLKSVGATMDDDEQGHNFMNAYFQRIDDVLLKSDKLPSRPRFMIMDLTDLRKAGWKGKDDAKGPKTIQQIHEEAEAAQARAEAERQRLSQRGGPGGRPPVGRGDARQFSGGGMQPPIDHRGTTVDIADMRRLQNRTAPRQPGTSLGPGGSLLGANRSGSRRGAGNLGGVSSGNTTRTNTPPVDAKDKKEEPSAQQNAFSALASLDPSGEGQEDAMQSEAAVSPPATRAKSPSSVDAPADDSNKPDDSSA